MNNNNNCKKIITNTFHDKFGDRFYHNVINNQQIVVSRRIPLRYDFNDVDLSQLTVEQLHKYGINVANPVPYLRRTRRSILNTFLLYTISLVLISMSYINMKRVLRALQNDKTLSSYDKSLFRAGFVISFIVILFLVSYIAISLFEMFRNRPQPYFLQNNHWYVNLLDNRFARVRIGILFFIGACILFSFAETINLFLTYYNPTVLILIIPILISAFILFQIFQTR